MMIRLFDKGLDRQTLKEVSEIATDDIKFNKIGFGKKTSVEYVRQVIKTSQIMLESYNTGGEKCKSTLEA